MLIRDVLILAAESLGRTDLSASIRSAYSAAVSSGTVPAGETAVLLRCYRLVENEVALDHLPLKAEERMTPSEGYLAFTDFSYPPVDVIEVCDPSGRNTEFEVFPARLRLKEPTGSVVVKYTYAPEEPTIDGETAFSDKVSARLLAFGVVREYLLSAGRYAEAAVWDTKYIEALRAAGLSRRKLCVRARRWV